MPTLHALNIFVHILFGSVALLLGPAAIWSTAHARFHVRAGRYFLGALAVVVGTALAGVLLFRSSSFLLVLTLLSGYNGYSGYRSVCRRDRRPAPSDWLLALLVLATGIWYVMWAQRQPNWSPAVVYPTLSALWLVTGYDLLKGLWLHGRLRKWWLYEHIYKMLSAYNAIVSAFAGTVLPQCKPYSQIGPTVLWFGVAVYFIRRQIRRERRRALAGKLLLLVLMLGSVQTVTAQPKPGEPAVSFTLSDQFGRATTLRFPGGQVIMLAFTDRNGGPQLRDWLNGLPPDPAGRVVPVACTGWVPFFVKESVRRTFLNRKPILIDWNNEVAKRYGYSGSGCLLVRIDPNGRVAAVEQGPVTPAKLRRLQGPTPP